MKMMRLIIYQNSANYKKEETMDNKMTYPLPPLSTIIGAIHSICGYKEYREMEISIQGRYESMQKIPYTEYCFLNSIQDDRGMLVKMKNKDIISNVFHKVASAQKKQGNSFRTGKTINVHDHKLLEEYRNLKDIGDKIDAYYKAKIQPVLKQIKRRKKQLSEKKKRMDKKGQGYENILKREKEIKKLEKRIKENSERYKNENYTIPISHYRVLITSMKYYETLNEIKLILHIKAEQNILQDIMFHINDLQAIGRSEDMVSVENADIVEIQEEYKQCHVTSKYSAYLDYELIKNGVLYSKEKGKRIQGTRYYLNRNYEIIDGKRIFNKKKVIYASDYSADEFGDYLYLDEYKGEKLIVNFL